MINKKKKINIMKRINFKNNMNNSCIIEIYNFQKCLYKIFQK